MPHPIVEIDELVRLVANYLVETSLRTAVSFALTCRSLEEPALSSLWKKQHLLYHLLRASLPGCARAKDVNKIVSGCDFLCIVFDINSHRCWSTILQRKTGLGCVNMLPGCANYTSMSTTTAPTIPFSNFHSIHLVDFCSPSWNC